jgi:translation initiation factor IF-3
VTPPRVTDQEEPAPTWRRTGAQVPGSQGPDVVRPLFSAAAPPDSCGTPASGPREQLLAGPSTSQPGTGEQLLTAEGRGEAITEPRINDRIRVPEVRLVGPEGEQVGIVPIGEALRLAQDSELDLVEVAPMARPPVVKLMDYGKFKYENAQKAREARRNQALTVIKEMRLRLKIDPHDYETKKGHVERFLKSGDKVKITVMFRGREQSRPEMGYRLLQRLAADVAELGVVESNPKQDGRNMVMVIAPHRNAALQAQQAQHAAQAERRQATAERTAEKAAERSADRSAPAPAPAEPQPEPAEEQAAEEQAPTS